MDRLTTPVQEFLLEPGVDPSLWTQFRITYEQNGSIILEKSEKDLDDMHIEAVGGDQYKLWFVLTQKETRKFYPYGEMKIQIRFKDGNGVVRASEKVRAKVADVLNHEIFADE